MPHPRRLYVFSLLFLIAASLSAGVAWWFFPILTTAEWRLVGAWTAPHADARMSYVTTSGTVTNPWRVWEFRRDRSYLAWIVSADDPGVSILDKEGRWRVTDGKLHLESFGAGGDAIRELRERVRIRLGGSYLGRTSGEVAHPIRFVDRDTWEMTTPRGKAFTWRRRHAIEADRGQ